MPRDSSRAPGLLEFGLLGLVEVKRDGESLRLGGMRQRALLAILVLNANEPVSRDRLIALLFGDDAGDGAANALQAAVSRLRRSFGDDSGVLATEPSGYALRVAPENIDLARFESLREQGRQARAGGDEVAAADAFKGALGQWRGPPLADLTELDGVQGEIRRLEALRLATEMDRIDMELAIGDGAELVGELDSLIAANPLQERLRRQLMLALYRSGRQADALALYRDTHDLLGEELGLEPSRELQELERSILRHDPALDGTPAPVVRGVPVCPFKGLGSFDVGDAEYFCGRERVVDELVARLAEDPLVGVVGPSGIGKSSILRAGLLSSLAGGALPGSERWPQHLLRPGAHPPADFTELIDAVPPGSRLVIAVDQLEEAFTVCSDEAERAAFFAALARAAHDPQRRTAVAVALRADYYGRFSMYPEFARLLSRDHVLVGPMQRDELERAVTLPADRAGLVVEPALVRTLVDDVEGEPGALPLLETALLELWRRRDGETMRLADYREVGGVRGAVARLADGTYERLDPNERRIARSLLLRLAAGEADAAVRRRVAYDELTEGRADVSRVLDTLIDARLLTVDDGAVEVAHEALLREWPRMRSWLAEEADARRLRARLASAAGEWDDGGREPADLYGGPRLAAVLDWERSHDDELTCVEQEFVQASRARGERELAAQRRRVRRLGMLLVGTAVLLVLALIAGFAALAQRGHARTAARVALARQLGAEAVSAPRIDQAMLLAREAVNLNPSPETEGALLTTLLRSPAAVGTLTWPITSRPQRLSISPDGRTLAVSDNDANVRFYDVATRRLRGAAFPFGFTEPPTWTGNSADVIGLGGPNGSELDVRDAHSLRIVQKLQFDHQFRTQATGDVSATAVSPSGTVVFVYALIHPDGSDSTAFLDAWNLRTGKRVVSALRLPDIGVQAVSFTAGGRRLVFAGDHHVVVIDARTWRVERRVPFVSDSGWVGINAGGNLVAGGASDGTVTVLDLTTGARRTLVGGSTAAVDAVAFSSDGRTLVMTAEDGSVTVWDLAAGTVRDRFAGHATRVLGVAISADGKTLYTCSLDGTLLIWDLGAKRRFGLPLVTIPSRTQPQPGVQEASETPPFALAPDGTRFAARIDDRRIGIFATATGARLAEFEPSVRHVAALAWSRAGLALSGDDGGIQLWRVARRPQFVRSFAGLRTTGHEPETVTALAFSPRGGLLAAGDVLHTPVNVSYQYGSVAVWDVATGRLLWRRRNKLGWVTTVAFSPDGQTVGDGDNSGYAALYSAQSGKRRGFVHVLGGGSYTTMTVAFAPDGTFFTGSWAGIVQRWDPATLRQIGTPTLVASAPVSSISFSPDGSTFATTGGSDGIAKLWSTSTIRQVGADLVGARGYWGNAAFTPDGRRLVVIDQDGTGAVWPTSVTAWEEHACAVAGRSFTPEEWRRFVGSQPYQATCPRQRAVSGS